MPLYVYTARDRSGQKVEATIEAENEREVVRTLQGMGYFPVSVREIRAKKANGRESAVSGGGFALDRYFFIGKRVKPRDMVIFSRQFATMIGAGLTLIQCLAILEEQTENRYLQRVIRGIRENIEAGNSLSDSLNKYKNIFTDLYINLVVAGEVSGTLDEVLERLADHLERDYDLRMKVKSALSYPAVVGVLILAVVSLAVFFILPRFLGIFRGFDVKLPFATILLMNITDTVNTHWPWFLAGALTLLFFPYAFYKTKPGKNFFDRLSLKVPIFKELFLKMAVARFAQTLGTLVRSGVPILQSMEIVEKTVNNVVISQAVAKARDRVREGEGIAIPLKDTKIFPPMVTYMISVGEETGHLEDMLEKIAEFFTKEVTYMTDNLASMIEPFMITILGVIVLFIGMAVYLPVFSMIGTLR